MTERMAKGTELQTYKGRGKGKKLEKLERGR
jgi:hypothetical protein